MEQTQVPLPAHEALAGTVITPEPLKSCMGGSNNFLDAHTSSKSDKSGLCWLWREFYESY